MATPANVEIRARVRGYLNAVHFADGQEAKAGVPLFETDRRTFEAELKNAEGQKAQWLAKREKAKADVSRYEGLVPTGAASAQDLDKARAEFGEAIAAINSADAAIDRAELDLDFSKITAPIDGQVGRALVTKGNLVQSGTGGGPVVPTTAWVHLLTHSMFHVEHDFTLPARTPTGPPSTDRREHNRKVSTPNNFTGARSRMIAERSPRKAIGNRL